MRDDRAIDQLEVQALDKIIDINRFYSDSQVFDSGIQPSYRGQRRGNRRGDRRGDRRGGRRGGRRGYSAHDGPDYSDI